MAIIEGPDGFIVGSGRGSKTGQKTEIILPPSDKTQPPSRMFDADGVVSQNNEHRAALFVASIAVLFFVGASFFLGHIPLPEFVRNLF